MNYIPGFSNHLQAAVPRYARGGRVMDGERMMYDEPMMYDGYDMGGYSEPYQYTPPLEQYMPVGQPMMYDMGGYNEMPYGGGGMLAEPVEQPYQQAAVEPMTTEAVPAEVPFDPNTFDFSKLDFSGLNLGGLDSLYGMNFASNFGGGPMGGIYQADPNVQYIAAPKSNRGDATGLAPGNTFAVRVDQPVRLVDRNTNTVVFEGTGFDAARKATELGQGITDARGRKANYVIQTANPSGVYTTVANENRNKTFLGEVANVVGTVAPLALGFIPGFGQLGLLAKMGAAAGAGGLGAALKGDDILKGALLGGATAGLVGGTGLDKAIGGALGGVAGKTAEEVAKQATGDIVVTGLSKGLQAAGGALGQAALSEAGNAASRALSGYKTPAEQFAQQPLPEAFQPPIDDTINVIANRAASAAPNYGGALANTLGPIATEFLPKGALPEPLPSEPTPIAEPAPVDDTIVVSGDRFAYGSGSPFAAAFPVPVNAMLSGTLAAAQPTSVEQSKTAEDIEAERNPIVVEARPEPLQLTQDIAGVGSALAGLPALGGLASDPYLTNYSEPYASDIVVTGNVPTVTQDVGLGSALAGLPAVLGYLPTDPALAAEAAPEKKLGLEDYLRIASLASGVIGGAAGGSGQTGTYTSGGRGLNPIFSAKLPAASGLGTIGANRTARPMGDVDWLTYGTRPELNFFDYASQANPAPITTPIPEEPRGPSMYVPDTTRFAQGGRAEFAVNGPGTGRSDDIPAVLSDGEYVIDAETVALLGDGSSKAGAKKLDELRVKVRKHKGKKLAKGRFSANAKKPEAYLSGGRI